MASEVRMKRPKYYPLLLLLCFVVFAKSSNVEAQYIATKEDNGIAVASITIREENSVTRNAIDSQQHSETIEMFNVNRQLSRVTNLNFFGRFKHKDNEPLVFQRVNVDVPRPQIWKRPDLLSSSYTSHVSKDVPTEMATVWYGESITPGFVGSASFIIDASGAVYGTITDGEDSYTISSSVDTLGSWRYKVDVVSMQDFPAEFESDEDSDDEDDSELAPLSRGLLRGTPLIQPHEQGRWLQSNVTTNGTVIVDVAVVYTEAVALAEGGDAAVHNLIGLSVFQTNLAFSNSGSNIRIRLVQTVQDNSFPDDSTINAWDAVRTESDGHFDYWEELRNETGADGIMFLVNHLPGWCGRAQSGGPLAIVSRGCTAKAGRYSFAHELGHWFHAGHDSVSTDDFDNRGFIDDTSCFRTLMAYANCNCTSCPRILYYSNNRTMFEGFAVGTVRENNLRIMELTAPTIESYTPTSSQSLPISLCYEDPCEEAPVMVSDKYNGDGRCSHIPGDNVVSSLQIPPGISMEVFEDYNFTGARRVFGNLNSTVVSLVDYEMDNAISSFILRAIPIEERVTLCSTFTCLGGTSERFSVGSYMTMNGTTIEEDTLSRVILPPGWHIELFEGRRFRGESLLLSNDIGNERSLNVRFQRAYAAWNNRVRSMIIGTL